MSSTCHENGGARSSPTRLQVFPEAENEMFPDKVGRRCFLGLKHVAVTQQRHGIWASRKPTHAKLCTNTTAKTVHARAPALYILLPDYQIREISQPTSTELQTSLHAGEWQLVASQTIAHESSVLPAKRHRSHARLIRRRQPKPDGSVWSARTNRQDFTVKSGIQDIGGLCFFCRGHPCDPFVLYFF